MEHTIHRSYCFSEQPVTARRTSSLEMRGSELAIAHAVPAHGQLEPYLGSVGSSEKIGTVWDS
jgi:hypothetical protein